MGKYEYLSNTQLSQAQREYLAFLEQRGISPRIEEVAVKDALGRMSARAAYARLSSPHYTACAMDGIALSAQKTFGATETTPVVLAASDFVRVDTGDPLPIGCDAVVMSEDCVEGDFGVTLRTAAAPWQHVRQIGEDLSAGDMILPSYIEIEPAMIGALLAGGVRTIHTLAKPRAGIIPTGDEIVSHDVTPREGEILEFNSAVFCAMLKRWGAEGIVYPVVKDDPPCWRLR